MFSVNPDFVDSSEDTVSPGQRVGMLQSMDTAYTASVYEATNKANEIEDLHYQQNKRLRELGEQDIPNINFMSVEEGGINVRDMEAVYSGKEPFYQNRESFDLGMKRVQQYDEHIERLREKYPDAELQTSKDMVSEFQARARSSATVNDTQRRTFGGSVGAFVGEVGAAFDPRYNLLNTLTLGVGGVGKTVAGRIGTEVAAATGIEAINEFTGGRSTREMRGLDGSLSGSFTRIVTAGAGAGILRGTGEGLVAGFKAGKRWFNASPGDPAPPPPKADTVAPAPPPTMEQQFALLRSFPEKVDPILAQTRVGTSRVLEDMTEVTKLLDDWSGGAPVELRLRSSVARIETPTGVRFSDDLPTRKALGETTVDETARIIDPDAFRIYDSLAARVTQLRTELAQNRPDTDEWVKQISEVNNKVSDLTDAIGNRKLKTRERNLLTAEREAAMAERDALMARPRESDTPRQAALRQEMQQADYKMRDLAPTITRAYARANDDFVASQATREAVSNMVKERRANLSDGEVRSILDSAKSQIDRGVPQAPPIPVASRILPDDDTPGGSLVDAALKVVARDAKLADETLTAFRESLNTRPADEGKITIGDHEFSLKDTLEIDTPDGNGTRTVTVGELLEELKEADYDLKAFKTCSI